MTDPSVPLDALSADIHLLGDLLGRVICEQHGPEAFDLVERVRLCAKARRNGASDAAQLAEIISGADLDARRVLIKAFSIYFQLINIAEDQQRIRVLREREASGTLHESLGAAVGALYESGLSAEGMRSLLNSLRVRLVLTAHPTEAKRKEVLVKLRRIAEMLSTCDRQNLLPRERHGLGASLGEEIEEIWQTRPMRASRPTVADELDSSIYFLTNVIMDVAVDLLAELGTHLEALYPGEDWSQLPAILQYATWVGGDRDGNPTVTPEVTLQTLATLREAARRVYLAEVTLLREHLTHSVDEVGVSPELLESVRGNPQLEARYPGEVYRQKMEQIRARLEADDYSTGRELLADLRLVQASLMQHRGHRVARGALRRLIEKVRLFGLHLMPVEIRDDARNNAAALAELFRTYGLSDDYLNLPENEKQALLTREIANPRPLFPVEPHFSKPVNNLIATWRMIAEAHRRYGPEVIDSVIASMTKQPSDVLAMLLLATAVGIDCCVDLVPLFETIDDLERAPHVMAQLFDNPAYAQHLASRGMRQQIMIGYSDSGKDGGYMAAKWGLYRAQQALATLCNERGILLELFHGRGGSIGRGGGPANRAILAQPPAAMQGLIRITEQGEVIAYRYSNPQIARRHLHQVMNAALIATATPPEDGNQLAWRSAMDEMAEAARRAYQELVYETVGFLDFWQQATPIHELTHLPIGSRPVKRGAGGFEAIRAIPWVFSWMQSRLLIPSWYGLGHALESFATRNTDGLETLREMYREWQFFQAIVENVQLDLAKTDIGIAELYAGLVEDAVLRNEVFTRVRAEYERTARWVCRIIGQEELMDNSPVLKRSIERRNPYVDPLNFIQVALLRELRQHQPGTPEYDELLQAVLATINGIAAGMKTTG